MPTVTHIYTPNKYGDTCARIREQSPRHSNNFAKTIIQAVMRGATVRNYISDVHQGNAELIQAKIDEPKSLQSDKVWDVIALNPGLTYKQLEVLPEIQTIYSRVKTVYNSLQFDITKLKEKGKIEPTPPGSLAQRFYVLEPSCWIQP